MPTHEIAILFLKFKDSIGLHTIGSADAITQDVINTLKGTNLPPEKTISLDAEMALIHAMQPKYNKEFYKNYPKSKDGLSGYNLDGYSFQIQSHNILQYENGLIKGIPGFNADSIIVKRDEPMRIIKNG